METLILIAKIAGGIAIWFAGLFLQGFTRDFVRNSTRGGSSYYSSGKKGKSRKR